MQVEDPPYLSVGTAVSAKYKGAFCEAKVSKVERMVKCKVTFRMGLGTATVTDNEIKGTLRVGQLVQVKHQEHKDLIEATITKIQDCSQYTVVFDDGDITTLRRTALCLKSGRHFNESETLDQLPLTHPEHFGNPVMGARRGRRNRQLKDFREDSSDEEIEEENEPDLEGYTQDIGRVVSVETTEKKRGKESWFPGLIVIPSAQPTVKINIKDEFLIRSFRDDRYYTVPKKEISEFNRDLAERIDSPGLLEAVQKAIKFLDHNDLPLHWEKTSLFNISIDSDSDDNVTDTSDDEQSEEKDRFVAQLYKFMDDSGTPLNKTPIISNRDIDLHHLFRVVHKLGGYNRATNQNKWKSVTGKMKLPINQNTSNQVKSVYRKCLISYEAFHRTLGVTMFNPIRSTKKITNRGRSLIRDKDRTPLGSPRPERDDEIPEKPIDKKEVPIPIPEKVEVKTKRKLDLKEDTKKSRTGEVSDSNSDHSEATVSTSSGRPKRHENKIVIKEKKVKPVIGDKVKVLIEKFEEHIKKEEKVQHTRSKSLINIKIKDTVTTRQNKDVPPLKVVSKPLKKVGSKDEEEKKPKLKKKSITETDKSSSDSSSTTDSSFSAVNLGDKLIVYYGPTNESKVTYEAKVVDIDKDQTGPIYLVHYTGWNTRYDEWIPGARIAENLTCGTKSKRSKHPPYPIPIRNTLGSGPSCPSTSKPIMGKRGRGMSLSGRASGSEPTPRSTTPSSVTSSSSRTKSPATPATRSSRLAARQESSKKRRTSAQTDVSVQSESDSDISESETELPRTRSGSLKTEETELRVYRKRVTRKLPTPKPEKRKEPNKEDEDTEKEEESEKQTRRVKKFKKSSEKSADESDEDSITHPKGRDFDLNQIRSELKGFAKALKVPSVDSNDKDSGSSSDESSNAPIKKEDDEEEEEEEKLVEPKPKQLPKLEKSSSSEDIYEFKEPEPFEFESRSKLVDDKNVKKRLPRIFEELEKSPKKKGGRSPSTSKGDKLDCPPEPKTYSRIPIKNIEDSDEELEENLLFVEDKNEDPFDKLIESPSFNIVKTSPEKPPETKPIPNILEEPLSLFRELPETSDEYSRDMELSDCESQTQIFTRADTLFTTTFSKSSPERTSPDLEFSSSKTDEGKTTNSDDDDMIQAQIQRAIAQSSSTDDDSNDTLMNIPIPPSFQSKEPEEPKVLSILGIKAPTTTIIETPSVVQLPIIPVPEKEVIDVPEKVNPEPFVPEPPKEKDFSVAKQIISPALQETDSSLLESIVSKPPLILNPKVVDDTGKDLAVKTGTKIADSILQKFNFIKNNIETKAIQPEPSNSNSNNTSAPVLDKLETKSAIKSENIVSEISENVDIKAKVEDKPIVNPEPKTNPVEIKLKVELPKTPIPKLDSTVDTKRRKRVISKPYIDESDSDSSDSEHLIIARSDDDSRTNSSDNKPLIECKESENSNMSTQKTITTDDSQSQPEERSFKFEDISPKEEKEREEVLEEPIVPVKVVEVQSDEELKQEEVKDEQDPNLHSLLLCEEEIPRSPAPAPEPLVPVEVPSSSSVHEMPFASAPGSSNSKMLLEPKKVQPPPLVMPGEREKRSDAQAVIENTPPTTPESTISNLSPRGDNGNISPNTNDSSKSNEGEPDFGTDHRRSGTMKVSPYSEEDTQIDDLSTSKKSTDTCGPPVSCRKRRRSLRISEDSLLVAPTPAKRGRKPLASRQRRDSDSDDASEHSNTGSCGGTTPGSTSSLYDRSARSPRPSKYNFFVEFDPSLDSGQRIAVLQQKLCELRKTYADVKTELAAVERRRKKIRRREREALKSAKQEMACA